MCTKDVDFCGKKSLNRALTIKWIVLLLTAPFTMSCIEEEWADKSPGRFTVVVIPDTQYMVMNNGYMGQYLSQFVAQANWIAANKDSFQIKYVAHLGDLVEDGDRPHEWENANIPMSTIEKAGIPYGIAPGNHDLNEWKTGGRNNTFYKSYNEHFSRQRYQKHVNGFQDGFPAGTAQNHYSIFVVDHLEFLVLNVQYHPSVDVLRWAEGVLRAHASKRVILNTHDVNAPGIYDLANRYNAIFLVVNGHYCEREWVKKNTRDDGSIWMDILTDYQGDGSNGWEHCTGGNNGVAEGIFRYYVFKPEVDSISAYTFSPVSNTYKTGSTSQFSWFYDM